MKGRALRRRLEVRPLGEQAAARDLGATGRTHLDAEFTLRAGVETVDDRAPISDFPHDVSPMSVEVDGRLTPTIAPDAGRERIAFEFERNQRRPTFVISCPPQSVA